MFLSKLEWSFLEKITTYDLSLRLTFVYALFFIPNSFHLDTPLRILSVLALIFPKLQKRKETWFLLLMGVFLNLSLTWWVSDNHQFLFFFWVCVVSLSFFEKERSTYLERNSRMLIGVCFLFAFLWKIIEGEYLNGSFMNFTLLTDHRFEFFTGIIGGISIHDLRFNQSLIDSLKNGMNTLDLETVYFLKTNENIKLLSLALSYMTLTIEILLTISFLSRKESLAKGRDLFMLLFLIGTYFIVPVSGFNFVLLILGMAQVKPDCLLRKKVYFIASLFFIVKTFPWIFYLGLIKDAFL